MKRLILILLFMLFHCVKPEAQLPIVECDVYIYEFAIKRLGRINLGFLIVERDSCQNLSFDVRFSKGKINAVNKTDDLFQLEDKIAERLGDFYCNSDDFAKKDRLIPDSIYKMISSSFLEITNKERLEVLNEYFARLNKQIDKNKMQ